jgi:hypothetical protein
MKKKLLTLTTVFFLAISAFAQLPDGSVAPNFTTTDINGNTHTLYDYLDQGYTVILDISATWCGPCWGYHTGGTFEDVWEDHGPAGMPGVSANTTDDVMILWFEGDASTTSADLNGTGDNTYGDWTFPDFPICDDNNIASLYNLPYWPIIYTICPNRLLTESGQATAAGHYANLNDCATAVEGLNAGIASYSGDLAASCDGEVNISVDVQNLGTENLTSFDIEIYDAGVSIGSESFSGNLSTYQITTIDFGMLTVTGTAFEIGITTSDVDISDNVLTQNISLAATNANPEVTVAISTDAYGSETTWEITNNWGTMVASGGPYPDLQAAGTTDNTPVTHTLGDGCYTFTIYDDYGDGINSGYGEGSYTVTDANGTTLASGGEFADSDVTMFGVGSGINSVSEEVTLGLNIYPNPTSTTANVVFTLGESALVTASLVNVLGKTVKANAYKLNAGNQKISFDVADVTAGVYFLQLDVNGQTTTQKITVAK